MPPETVIYALAAGETRRAYEEIISAPGRVLSAADIENIQAQASRVGWHSFRVMHWGGDAPDFAATVAV